MGLWSACHSYGFDFDFSIHAAHINLSFIFYHENEELRSRAHIYATIWFRYFPSSNVAHPVHEKRGTYILTNGTKQSKIAFRKRLGLFKSKIIKTINSDLKLRQIKIPQWNMMSMDSAQVPREKSIHISVNGFRLNWLTLKDTFFFVVVAYASDCIVICAE